MSSSLLCKEAIQSGILGEFIASLPQGLWSESASHNAMLGSKLKLPIGKAAARSPLAPVSDTYSGRQGFSALRRGGGLIALSVWLSLISSAHSQAKLEPPPATAPVSFEAVSTAAAAARRQGDADRAISLYAQAVSLRPDWPEGWWFLGSLQYGANRYAPARDALSRYILIMPSAGPAIALRGLCEFETGQYAESLDDLRRGIALGAAAQPRNAGILLYHEGLLLARAGDFEGALGTYTTLAKQGPVDDDVAIAIGLAGLRFNLFPTDLAEGRAPSVSLVRAAGQAAAGIMHGDVDAGAQAFQEVSASYPGVSNVHYFCGYLLFPTRPDAAIAQFRQELTISPSSAVTNAMLAWALGIQGDYADALSPAEKAAIEDPSLPMAQLVLGRALVETGAPAQGLPHLKSALKVDGGNIEAHMATAKAYSELGRKEDARRERLESMRLSTGGADAAP